MTASTRKTAILQTARQQGFVSVDDLRARFGVTPQTIRRDLAELCDDGAMARVHGGAVPASGVANVGYDERRAIAAEQKTAIGRLCAAAIPDASSLFVTVGTTTEAVARALFERRDLMVVTNNLNVATILASHPSCEIVVAGGRLRRADGALVGEATVDVIRQYKLDIAVIGASAIDEDGALLDYDQAEARAAQAVIANARKVYLAADGGKFARAAPVRVAEIGQVDRLFTDLPPPSSLRERCMERGVAIDVAKPVAR